MSQIFVEVILHAVLTLGAKFTLNCLYIDQLPVWKLAKTHNMKDKHTHRRTHTKYTATTVWVTLILVSQLHHSWENEAAQDMKAEMSNATCPASLGSKRKWLRVRELNCHIRHSSSVNWLICLNSRKTCTVLKASHLNDKHHLYPEHHCPNTSVQVTTEWQSKKRNYSIWYLCLVLMTIYSDMSVTKLAF